MFAGYKISNKTPIINLAYFFIAFVGLCIGCNRPVPVSDNGEDEMYIEQPISFSKENTEKILNVPVPLKRGQINKEYALTIPLNYGFETTEVSEEEIPFGKLTISKEKNNAIIVDLTDNLFDEPYATETVYLIKEKNPALITMDDFLSNETGVETTYYKDANSVVLQKAFSVFTYHFTYDTAAASYIVYVAETSHFKQFKQNEQADIGLHLLRTAKNLTAKNFPASSNIMWEMYAAAMPKVKLDFFKKIFKKFDKEMKAFLATGEKTTSKGDGDNASLSLYHTTNAQDLAFLDFVNSVNTHTKRKDELEYDRVFVTGYNTKYNIVQQNNIYIIKSTYSSSDEGMADTYDVLCRMEYEGKVFYLRSPKDITQSPADLYTKMFAQFSKYKTLEPQQPK